MVRKIMLALSRPLKINQVHSIMIIALHKNARTTLAIRAEIAAGKDLVVVLLCAMAWGSAPFADGVRGRFLPMRRTPQNQRHGQTFQRAHQRRAPDAPFPFRAGHATNAGTRV
jgi:hypothetical protein